MSVRSGFGGSIMIHSASDSAAFGTSSGFGVELSSLIPLGNGGSALGLSRLESALLLRSCTARIHSCATTNERPSQSILPRGSNTSEKWSTKSASFQRAHVLRTLSHLRAKHALLLKLFDQFVFEFPTYLRETDMASSRQRPRPFTPVAMVFGIGNSS